MFLLSADAADWLGANVRRCSRASGASNKKWWLRSASSSNACAAILVDGDSGNVEWGYNVIGTLGVRPALKLDLSKVVFSSGTKAFLLPQTVTADDVTASYGETDKRVAATSTGDGQISYAVKDGSADSIDIASDGTLTLKKAGTATVVVTAAETPVYTQASKEVTVTINKAIAVAAVVSANSQTYDGTEKPLVTVDDSALIGGEMRYALGTDANTAPADNLYTTSIPTATDAGTYYVWYKVVGDENHTDSEAACVTSTISEKSEPAPAEVTYAATKGAGSTWTRGSKGGLAVTFKRSDEGDADTTFEHFASASVDGKALTRGTDYAAAKGSVVVTLAPAYLGTLAAGKHTLTATFDDGAATADFTVAEAATARTSSAPFASRTGTTTPKTGDPTSLAAVAALAAGGSAALVAARRRRH